MSSKTFFGDYKKVSFGFTLIELLIVMGVIAGLAAIFITTYPGAQRKARDARRMSDIKQYQTAMEVYANKNDGKYLPASGNPASYCTNFGLTGCPDDPHYGISSTNTEYQIWARLEIPNTAGQTQYFVACSNGKTGITTTFPTGSTCQI